MAAYRLVDGLKSPTGSAPGPTLGNEYGRTLPFYAETTFWETSLSYRRFCYTRAYFAVYLLAEWRHAAKNTAIIILSSGYIIIAIARRGRVIK